MYDYGLNGSHNDGMFLANMSFQTCLSVYDESKNQERAEKANLSHLLEKII